jgi:hypothetical protein
MTGNTASSQALIISKAVSVNGESKHISIQRPPCSSKSVNRREIIMHFCRELPPDQFRSCRSFPGVSSSIELRRV